METESCDFGAFKLILIHCHHVYCAVYIQFKPTESAFGGLELNLKAVETIQRGKGGILFLFFLRCVLTLGCFIYHFQFVETESDLDSSLTAYTLLPFDTFGHTFE